MAGPAIAFNMPGLESQLPDYIRSIEQRIATGEKSAPPAADLPALREALEDARFFLDQKRGVSHTLPTRTFRDRLDLTIGERQVQILNYGRAVTPGDAFMYLPKDACSPSAISWSTRSPSRSARFPASGSLPSRSSTGSTPTSS